MKLRIHFLENNIDIQNDFVNSLEIENKKYFFRIVQSLYELNNSGSKSDDLTFFDDTGQEINNINTNILVDYFNLEVEDKKVASMLQKNIINSLDESMLVELANAYKKMYSSLNKVLRNIELPLVIKQEFEPEVVLKATKVSIQKYDELMDNLLLLIDVEKVLKAHSITIFINLKQYLSKEELKELYKYAVYNGVKIFLIDNQSYGPTIELERKLIVDDNLDEFML